MEEKSKLNKILRYVLIYLCFTACAFVVYYVTLPPLHLQSESFWLFLTFLIALYTSPFWFKKAEMIEILKAGEKKPKHKKGDGFHFRPVMIAIAVPIAVLIVGQIASSTFFNARKYAAVIDVTEAVFSEDMPQTENVTNIALMDSETASIVGNRTLGSLSDVVSQYEISYTYNQINYKRTPQKVATLEYAGFFKWIGNRKNGIPGYVMVDPVNNTAEYCELSKPIHYAESGFLGDDLMRKLRFSFPTKILGTPRYEIDDEGNPMYIVPCLKPQVAMFGAVDVHEVILFDPITGEGQLYGLDETPAWIDGVYDGYLATEKYNWKGILSGGFWNSVIGNKDCKQTTDDFGYIVIEDDVWYFTGVTSVNSDQSNIGFIISNARTGEYKFYPVIGAEEHSAMGAAQGEVQEKGYVASFPALINVKGQATYIMVLKDAGGLVKLYALVNVEQYRIVATGTTQEKAMAAYKQLLYEEGILTEQDTLPDDNTDMDTALSADLLIKDVNIVTMDGESYLYFTADYAENEALFKIAVKEDETALLIKPGDTVSLRFVPISQKVYQIVTE